MQSEHVHSRCKMSTAGPPAKSPTAGPRDAAAGAVEWRLSLPAFLLREGSLTGQGSMSLGSQDLAGLLESTIQRVQTGSSASATYCAISSAHLLTACLPASLLPVSPSCEFHPATAELEFDVLSSPKWKALLSWEDDSSPMHLDTAGSSATRVPQHCAFGQDSNVGSPSVDQKQSVAALEAAWLLAQATSSGRAKLLRQASGHSSQGLVQLMPLGDAAPAGQPLRQSQQHLLEFHPQQQQQHHHRRPQGFGGKKRPAVSIPQEEEGAPAAKQARHQMKRDPEEEEQQHQEQDLLANQLRQRLVSLTSGDAMMMDAEAAAAEAAAAAAAFDAAAAAEFGTPAAGLGLEALAEDASPSDVVARLNRVRLNSLSASPLQQRRMTAAAAAAAITPAGRRGRVQRHDSNVPMLMAALPGSPTAGAAQLLPAEDVEAGHGSSDVLAPAPAAATPGVAVKAEPQAQIPPSLPRAAPVAVPGAAARATAEAPAPAMRWQLPSKSHKAVATGD
jgi:hypothetical protein